MYSNDIIRSAYALLRAKGWVDMSTVSTADIMAAIRAVK